MMKYLAPGDGTTPAEPEGDTGNPASAAHPVYDFLGSIPWITWLNILLGILVIVNIFTLALAVSKGKTAERNEQHGQMAAAHKQVGYNIAVLIVLVLFGTVLDIVWFAVL